MAGYPLAPAPQPSPFLAGAARVDITPPPGFPIAGHSISAGIARGYWTKLYARAFYFQDESGRVLVLVSCELYAVPAGLRSEVLRRLNRGIVRDSNGNDMEGTDNDKLYLPPDSFILAATHTHHGPGGYMTAAVYNGFGAALPGFDPKIFDTYAVRIADAVRRARTDATMGGPATIEVRQGSAPYLQRNRAIDPFYLNREEERDAVHRLARAGGVLCDCPRLAAVDPTLTTLQILHNNKPGGILVFYAIHPTAMSHENPLYSSDLAGRAMLILEKANGVAGFFNGAEGDISPDWDRQNRDDVLKLGAGLASAVTALQNTPAPPAAAPPCLDSAMEKYPNNWNYQRPNDEPKFAYEPLAGVAQIGGAEDGRTAFFYIAGWRAGITSDTPTGRDGDQGYKEPGLGAPVTTLLNNLDAGWLASIPMHIDLTRALTHRGFPTHVPVMVAHIGNLITLAAFPVEMTTTMGVLVRDGLKARTQSEKIVLVGLANEYFSYTTTPLEYTAQQYEGASTLAGPQEGPAIREMLQKVSEELPGKSKKASGPPPQANVRGEKFSVGPKRILAFGPKLLGKPRNMVDEDLDPLLPPYLVHHESRIPRVQWSEPMKNDWNTEARFIRVRDADGREIEGDGSPNILAVLADSGEDPVKPSRLPDCADGVRCWNALWIPPSGAAQDRTFYFEVTTPDRGPLCSEKFQLSTLPQDSLPRAMTAKAENCPNRVMTGR